MKNVLVGTLYSGEKQYDACRASVREQTHPHVDHFTIKNKSHREAHTALYKRFMEHRDSHDVFIKVDADMILTRSTLFEEILQEFETRRNLRKLTIAVHDFFTDQNIYGLHSYTNKMHWTEHNLQQPLLVDMDALEEHQKALVDHLAPAAFHCPNPSVRQSYVYGAKRGVKLRSVLEQRPIHSRLDRIGEMIRIVCKNEMQKLLCMVSSVQPIRLRLYQYQSLQRHYMQTGNERLLYALIGYNQGLTREIDLDHLDFTGDDLEHRVQHLRQESVRNLKQRINFGRPPNSDFLLEDGMVHAINHLLNTFL